MRAGFILLLLLNYLLVVGAGLVERPAQPRYSAARPYVHSKDCQQRNYLRLDCFDTCNGDQSAVQAHPTHDTPQHLLSALKGLDLHCLAETRWSAPPSYRVVGPQWTIGPATRVPISYLAGPDLPPRIG